MKTPTDPRVVKIRDAALTEVRVMAGAVASERKNLANLEATLADRIQRAHAAGLSLRDLEAASGLKKSSLGRIVNGGAS